MEDTREHKKTDGILEGEARRRFMRAVLADLRALEQMLAAGAFERGVTRIGAEQELFIVDHAYHPAPGVLKILEKVDDPHFTTELGLFQIEANADPQLRMEAEARITGSWVHVLRTLVGEQPPTPLRGPIR